MAIDLIAFGPHPDDVEIGLGGTIARHASAGYSVGLCDLTAGELGSNGTPAERRREAAAAARTLGVEWRENLGLPDGELDATSAQVGVVVELHPPPPAKGRRGAVLGRPSSRSPRREPPRHPRRLHERAAALRNRQAGVAARLGLLLLHQ